MTRVWQKGYRASSRPFRKADPAGEAGTPQWRKDDVDV